MYHHEKSTVKVNPVRLSICLVFPEPNDAEFKLDLELRGIIRAEQTSVEMFATKVEITMRKAEAGTWSKLDFPRPSCAPKSSSTEPLVKKPKTEESDSDFDLDDIENVGTPEAKVSDIS